MPYIHDDSRKLIKDRGIQFVLNVGDLNYVITEVILAAWNEHPRYETLHMLRKEFVTEPKSSKFLNYLRNELSGLFTVADVYTAAAEAYTEFRERVGSLYETHTRTKNGDLPGYIKAISDINEKNLAGTEVK